MKTPAELVTSLFIASDQRDWQGVEDCFADDVTLDYSSMNGSPAASMVPQQITTVWKTILPGFASTHHQIGNVATSIEGDLAQVFCYGTATHYLADDGGNVWTVVGTYDFDLKQIAGAWKITSMRFNYKYQDGNTALPAKAIANVKSE